MAPPSAIDIERVLLGAALLGATTLLTVVDILPPGRGQWFYQDAHRLIYDAMLTLLERHGPIDLETVTDVLRRRGTLEKAGGSVYLAELMEYVTTTANVAFHARIVRDKLLYRAMINIGTDVTSGAYGQDELSEIIHRTHQALLDIASVQSTSSFTTMHDMIRHAIHQAEQAEDRDLSGVHTGVHRLNYLTGGFQNANLIILAARPSMGKSALAMQFALSAAQSIGGAPVAIFSLEMSSQELGVRLLCSEARVDSQRLKHGFLDRAEFGQLFEAADRLNDVPILIDATSNVSVLDVRTRAKRLQMERGLGLIIIDYLQLMSGPGQRSENRQQEVAAISRDLKSLAKELNVPVIALSQLS
jgi:replicative DNA helicase